MKNIFVCAMAAGLAGTLLAGPFDDVKYMFSGGVDADGNGILTHTNINPYKPGDPLLPSGLLGPVQVMNVGLR